MSQSASNTSRRRIIGSSWNLTEVPHEGIPAQSQLPTVQAIVPGHVHQSLEKAGVIPDPFRGVFEHSVAWIDESDWVYDTKFFATEQDILSNPILVFHGIDTVAAIELNGQHLGNTDNMFLKYEFPVAGVLAAGDNVLRITIRSAIQVGRERQAEWNRGPDAAPENDFVWSARSFVRKAQYMYGWDWGPVLVSAGIWKDVELITSPLARIIHWQNYSQTLEGNGLSTRLTVKVDIERSPTASSVALTLKSSLKGHGANLTVETAVDPDGSGIISFVLDNPALWQPNGAGLPSLYNLSIDIVNSSGSVVDSLESKIGIRKSELIREPDADGKGESFKFRINDRDLFIKGANWIPDHSFPATIAEAALRKRITQAREAGCNMLRVWGGGLYESEDFYNICDELGILVWQDFAYACAYYPDLGEYAEAARIEAVDAVRRIRNHPSLAIWCGNNENYTMFVNNWNDVKAPRYLGEHIYNEVLPTVVAAENPEIPYWPSSPYSGSTDGDPDSQLRGDNHNWDVWHGRGDWVHYVENDTRFCSEFGFAASPGLAAWDYVFPDNTDIGPRSLIARWHDKTQKGYDTYLGYVDIHYPPIETLDDLIYYSQANQADALRFGVEHYRRRMGHCWGTLYWQLNDCWPVQSWAVIDSLGEPRAAYFATRRFYAPVLLSLYRKSDEIEVHLISDLLTAVPGNLTVSLRDFSGKTIAQHSYDATALPNQASMIASLSFPEASAITKGAYVTARFEPDDLESPSADSHLLLAEPKELELPDAGLELAIGVGEDDRVVVINVTANSYAPYVWLSLHGIDGTFRGSEPLIVSDNFFHLEAGETKSVVAQIPNGCRIESFSGRLTARSMKSQIIF